MAADTEMLTPPCGACRQILWEFCGDIEVDAGEPARQDRDLPLERAVPEAFDASFLVACFSACVLPAGGRRAGRLDLERRAT